MQVLPSRLKELLYLRFTLLIIIKQTLHYKIKHNQPSWMDERYPEAARSTHYKIKINTLPALPFLSAARERERD